MAQLIESHDWSASPLGSRDAWPLSLRTAVDLMLATGHASCVAWGEDLVLLYNDGFAAYLGERHPAALGQPLARVLPEFREAYRGHSQRYLEHPVTIGSTGRSPLRLSLSTTPLTDDAGTVRGYHSVVTSESADQSTQFRTLVDQAPMGIYLIDADFTMRHVNPVAAPVFSGIANLIGRDFGEVLRILWPEPFASELEHAFRQVLITGKPLLVPERAERRADINRLEYYTYRMNRTSLPDGRFGIVCYFREITDEVVARQAFAESKRRQDFLLELSDVLRPMDDASRIIGTASRHIALHLGVSRAYYLEYDESNGASVIVNDFVGAGDASIAGTYDIRAFGEAMARARSQRILAVDDVSADADAGPAEKEALTAINVRAKAFAALVKSGRLVALFNVAHAAPRHWTPFELSLIEETAERTWAAVERARAEYSLRQSEEHYRASVELSPQIAWTAEPDGRVSRLSPRWTEFTGLPARVADGANWMDAVHPGDSAAASRLWQTALRNGTPFDEELRIHTRASGYHWARVRAYPQRDADQTILQWFGSVEDVQERHAAASALRDSEHRLQTLIEGVPQLVWRAVGNGRWTWSSPQWTQFTGLSPEESREEGWLQAVHPDDRAAARAAWTTAASTGAVLDVDFRLLHAAEQRYRWFQSRAAPVRDRRGEVIEWLGTSTDIDDQRQMQARQELLVAELQHRTRNLMAVVQSTSDKTLRSSRSLEEFALKFRERLAALSRVQGLLSRLEDGNRIMFDELLRSELAAHGVLDQTADRVELRGPSEVPLRSSTVQMFAMALHELATNALKYGALRQPQGRLEVQWCLDPVGADSRPWLHVDWRERHVDMPSAPARGAGHGRELIERALPFQLGARTRFSLESDGVHCIIAMPISQRAAGAEPEAATKAPP